MKAFLKWLVCSLFHVNWTAEPGETGFEMKCRDCGRAWHRDDPFAPTAHPD